MTLSHHQVDALFVRAAAKRSLHQQREFLAIILPSQTCMMGRGNSSSDVTYPARNSDAVAV